MEYNTKMGTAITNDSTTLGQRLRAIRKENGWKIADVAQMTGLAVSTISKVENGRMSLTYDKLTQLASGLGMDLADVLAPRSRPAVAAPLMVTGRSSVTRPKDYYHISARDYDYWYLNSDLTQKAIIPILGETRAKSIEEFGELIRHEGEEFLFVLEGSVLVYTEFYSPVRLDVGDCIYIDSTMGHAYIAVDCDKARFLCGCSKDDKSHMVRTPRVEGPEGVSDEAPSGRKRAAPARAKSATVKRR